MDSKGFNTRKQNDALVSVIVPVYNTGKYLRRCVDSIRNQTHPHLEVILVDDGSTDNSGKLCDALRLEDDRIIVIHKENAGLGEARNTGLESAKGTYICFVDSDDYIDEHLVKDCVEFAKQEDLDIVSYGFVRERRSGEKVEMPPTSMKSVYFGREVQEQFLPELMVTKYRSVVNYLQMSLCASFIKHELINDTNWRSASERELISEDVYSLLQLYRNVNAVGVINKAYYHYVENPQSLTNTFNQERYNRNTIWYAKCIELCDELGYDERIKTFLSDQFFSNTIGTLKSIVASGLSFRSKVKAIRLIGNDKYMRKVLCDKRKYTDTWRRKTLARVMRWRWYVVCTLLLFEKL